MLAWNALATTVFADFAEVPAEHRTIGWLVFCHPGARGLYVDWEFKARETVAYLRTEAGKRPHDAALGRHVHELCAASEDFRRLWSAQFVLATTHATCRLACPALDTVLELSWETFQMTGRTADGSQRAGRARLVRLGGAFGTYGVEEPLQR